MSIQNSNEPAIKRRKLSHSSVEEDHENAIQAKIHAKQDSNPVFSGESPSNPRSIARRPMKSKSLTNGISGSGSISKTSIMAIQVDGLLEDVRPDHEAKLRKLKPILEKTIEIIKSAPDRPALPLASAEKTLRKQRVAIPFAGHQPDHDIKYQFGFQSPQSIRIRGSLAQHVSVRGNDDLELEVQMPSGLFQEKDYLNFRALHKRAFYLACLAYALEKELKDEANCSYAMRDGNTLLPIIVLKFNLGSASIQIHVHATFPSEVGPIEKTLPGRNCLRSITQKAANSSTEPSPTPFYNSSIRAAASIHQYDQLLEKVATQCESFRDTCMLGQVWLRQRGLDSSSGGGGFGSYEWSVMCALLLSSGGHKDQPLFSARYSVLQLFKAMLQVLAGRDLREQPMIMNPGKMDLPKSSQAVLYDGSTGVNLLYKMSSWSYQVLKAQAQLSVTAANSRNEDNFDSLFIWKGANPSLQFDEIWSIDISVMLDCQPTQNQEILNRFYNVLNKGLGDRVSELSIKQTPSRAWGLTKSEPKQSRDSSTVEIYIRINPDAVGRIIDHGPSAEEPEEAKEFRNFWGEKSELRRFRDGSITEALVWSGNASITFQIIQYLAAYHFKVAPSSIKPRHHVLPSDFGDDSLPVQAIDAFEVIHKKYQDLSSKLHQLEGLPLPIRSVSPADPALRSATTGHPLSPLTACPVNMIIQFDSSARWPDHLPAIQYTKIAFLAKLADLLTETDSSLTTSLGVENTDSSKTGYFNTSFLDIISPSSAPGLTPMIFRLRIHHDREQHLLQSAIASATSATREALTTALTEHKRQFLASPIHTTAVRNLITHFHPLASTISLLKAWIAHHHLSNHIPPPTLELIAAHVFLHPTPWPTPGSATTAFLRCLHFLSHWDWTSKPLLVDLSLSQDMPQTAYQELDTRFQAWKKLDPGMNTVAWFVGTNIDPTGTVWTQGAKPSRVVAGRATALAKAATELIQSKGTTMQESDWKDLFASPLTDFDFVLHLKNSIVRGGTTKNRNKNRGATKFKNVQVQEDLDVDGVGHDVAALLVEDLEKSFGNSCLFFRGEGGGVVAGLWKPSTTGVKGWRVRLGWSSVPVAGARDGGDEDEAKCLINKDAMLVEMGALGEGMIERITLKE